MNSLKHSSSVYTCYKQGISPGGAPLPWSKLPVVFRVYARGFGINRDTSVYDIITGKRKLTFRSSPDFNFLSTSLRTMSREAVFFQSSIAETCLIPFPEAKREDSRGIRFRQ
jgi:hypothetical protein